MVRGNQIGDNMTNTAINNPDEWRLGIGIKVELVEDTNHIDLNSIVYNVLINNWRLGKLIIYQEPSRGVRFFGSGLNGPIQEDFETMGHFRASLSIDRDKG